MPQNEEDKFSKLGAILARRSPSTRSIDDKSQKFGAADCVAGTVVSSIIGLGIGLVRIRSGRFDRTVKNAIIPAVQLGLFGFMTSVGHMGAETFLGRPHWGGSFLGGFSGAMCALTPSMRIRAFVPSLFAAGLVSFGFLIKRKTQ